MKDVLEQHQQDQQVQQAMNFQTRVMQATTSAEPCLKHFPVRVQTTTAQGGSDCYLQLLQSQPLALPPCPACPQPSCWSASRAPHWARAPGVAALSGSNCLPLHHDRGFGSRRLLGMGELPLSICPWWNPVFVYWFRTPTAVWHKPHMVNSSWKYSSILCHGIRSTFCNLPCVPEVWTSTWTQWHRYSSQLHVTVCPAGHSLSLRLNLSRDSHGIWAPWPSTRHSAPRGM